MPAPRLSILILSHNRRDALERTLRGLLADPAGADAQIIVADNASSDDSAELVRASFPRARWLPMESNMGVEAFNRAAALADGRYLLILDDDALPDRGVLAHALDLLDAQPRLGGVALHPVHPRTHASEWRFLRARHDHFPAFGCANLVRADAWRQAGGYERAFFLYRNDADLALTLLALGWMVHARPDWIAWHDSPVAARKSDRWLRLATRNWCWLVRRHARGATKPMALAMGVAWALRLAGLAPRRWALALRGALAGVLHAAPPLPSHVRPDGTHLARLVRLQLSSRANASSRSRHSA